MNEFLKLPVPTGRINDDDLATGERAVVDWLAEIPRDRLRAVIAELLSLEKLRIELEEMLLDDEGL